MRESGDYIDYIVNAQDRDSWCLIGSSGAFEIISVVSLPIARPSLDPSVEPIRGQIVHNPPYPFMLGKCI